MTLEGVADHPLQQLAVGHAGGREQLAEHAGLGGAGNSEENVDQDLVAVDEEVHPRQAGATRPAERLERQLPHQPARRLGHPGRDDELHPARGVLGLVVVPLAGRHHDLPGLGGDRLAIADHRALDLQPSGGGLDDRPVVVGEGAVQRGSQLVRRGDLDDPHRRAQRCRLDEHRQPQLRHLVGHRLTIRPPAVMGHRRVADLRDSRTGHQLLEHHLVHARRAGQHAGAHVRHVQALEQPLNRPVLPVGPVQYRERDVDVEQAAAGRERHLRSVDAPAAGAIDLDGHDIVAHLRQRCAHRRGRGERDLVLGRAPAGEDGESHLPDGDGGWGVGAEPEKRPTVIVTVEPGDTRPPACGRCASTWPSLSGEPTLRSAIDTPSPAADSVELALPSSSPTTPGTVTRLASRATTIVTVEPLLIVVPAPGSWLSTVPAGWSDSWLTALTVSPLLASVAWAPAWSWPTTVGTITWPGPLDT